MDSRVSQYLRGTETWKSEQRQLADILSQSGMEESIKWGQPCYSHEGQLVVGVCGFKDYFGLWFYQGSQMPDPQGVLINAQPGKTVAMRQWRMTSSDQIDESLVRQYVADAIAVFDEGRDIKPAKHASLDVPPLLAERLESDPALRDAFDELSPGRQREYADHVAEAKRASTRERRLEKIVPMILDGVGLNDKYR